MVKVSGPKVMKGNRRSFNWWATFASALPAKKRLRQLKGILYKRFVDGASEKALHRPELEQLTGHVHKGDTVICRSMERLARNLDHLRRWFSVH